MKLLLDRWLYLFFGLLLATMACAPQAPAPTSDAPEPGAGPAVIKRVPVIPRSAPRRTSHRSGNLVAPAPVAPPSYGSGGNPGPATPTGYSSAGDDVVATYAVSGDALVSDFATNQGGPTIGSVQLELLFWGNAWDTESPSAGTIVSSVQKIMASTYLDAMGQYGYQNIALHGSTQVLSDPPSSFSFDDVTNMVWGLIDQGTFPEPGDPGGSILFMVFMPQTATYNGGNARGAHGDPWKIDDDDLSGIQYAWAGWIGAGTLDYTTDVFSHELVESISDPEPHAPAWVMDRAINGGDEIGDACNNTVDYLDGVMVQAYWSEAQGACVIPFQPPPTVSFVSPSTGNPAGGQSVRIAGSNFDVIGNSTEIFFGGVQATNVSCSSTTQCTATTPAGNGDVNVTVRVNHFTSAVNASSGYAYVPSVTGVSPASGFVGDTVTVHGIGFLSSGTTVSFGPNPSPSVNCYPGPDCVVTVPAGSGTVDVIVTSQGYTSTPAVVDRFSYNAPIVSSVQTNIGPMAGGTSVTITGSGFDSSAGADGSTQILFGGVPSPSFSCYPGSWCQATSPAVTFTGPVDVRVRVDGALSAVSSADLFTYRSTAKLAWFQASAGTGRLGLDGWAPPGGAVVTLTSSNPAVVSVPPSVTVPAGVLGASFGFIVEPTAQSQSVTITASYDGSSLAAPIGVAASPPLALSIPAQMATGASATAAVMLNVPAPAGGATVTLSAVNGAGVTFPASVTIPAGEYGMSFTISNAYGGTTKLVTVDAAYDGLTATASVRVPPAVVVIHGGCTGTRCI